MNKEQLEAIKERVASMKQQARTGVTADILAIEIAFQDTPALVEEVERLRERVALDFFRCGETTTAFAESVEENKRLREALETIATDEVLSYQEIIRLAEKALKGGNDNE